MSYTNNKDDILKKKKFLESYYWQSYRLEKLQKKLERINDRIESIKTSNISIMPKGGTHLDIVDLLAIQEEYQRILISKMSALERTRKNIELSIQTIEDAKLESILSDKYLENLSYKEIGAELNRSDRHIRRLHDIGIRLMKIIEE